MNRQYIEWRIYLPYIYLTKYLYSYKHTVQMSIKKKTEKKHGQKMSR